LALGIAAVGVAAARGDGTALLVAADRLTAELGEVPDSPDLLARWCAVAKSQVHAISDDPEHVTPEMVPGQGDGYAAAAERVALGRTHLAAGRTDLLPALLGPLTEPGVPFLGPVVEARILLSLAADREHRDTAALTQLTEAIDLAEPENMIRPFLDAGPALRGLLARHRNVIARHHDFTRQATAPTGVPAQDAATGLVGEHLTERELIVLRYLPTMLKAGEIAKDLYVSVNTVKSHLRAIYRKLDVTTRRDAVERARDRNMI
jgi:LuxR family maltose regulon positive regulatory protein